ncbi:YtzI protein [Mesobacillus maritimus]|uniref:YtzI protein n=1 Tax=Mesobacillus maritimus TaxID=1643336 RepID=A0ABS7K4K0_9BACI|nr:YtzI protein [Mesobacillus maritimus]MBY0097197.1 YtzI protein [Mesobacillus maritimus]
MLTVLIISIIIVFIVLILAVTTTSKAYTYKHTVDPIEENPYLKTKSNADEEQKKNNEAE